MSGKKLE